MLLAAALVAGACVGLVQQKAAAIPIPGGQATTMFVPGADGVMMNAIITAPPDIGAHRNALVLQPSGWGMPAMGSLGSAYRLSTESGFISIEYTARGMYLSGGEVNTFGAKDAEDASAIIDWAIANLNVDPGRIAVAGGSYGAGLGIAAAAHDPRIKAILADSPPGDVGDALAPNGTPKTGGPVALALAGIATNRFSPELTRAFVDATLRGKAEALTTFEGSKVIADAIPKLNANGTAVFLAHDWQDSLLPAGPLYTMFDQLTGPKMLYLAPGDHSTAGGAGGVAGLPNSIWDAGRRWLDHYVNGVENGIEKEPVVRIQPANRVALLPDESAFESFDSVAGSQAARQSYPLSAPSAGVIGADAAEFWSQPLVSGATAAVSAIPYVTGTAAQVGLAPTLPLASVDRSMAAVWRTQPFGSGGLVSGNPRLGLTVVPSTSDLTLIATLYDEAPDGNGTVVTYWPMTRHGLVPGESTTIEWDLAPTYWNLAPGHRLAVTVTTQDPIPFQSSTPIGSTVVFASPSVVELPVAGA